MRNKQINKHADKHVKHIQRGESDTKSTKQIHDGTRLGTDGSQGPSQCRPSEQGGFS